ncbi:MAG: cytochrome P450, partial [Anaerolineae bacterium]|nr:cytochrome P450 [Anaerolineae bacterium]
FWKKQRKLVQPAFHSQRIGAYAGVISDYAQQMVTTWSDGQTREIHADMVGLTMRIIAKTLFDAEMEDEVAAISAAITQILEVVNRNTTSLFNAPAWMPTADNRSLKAGVAKLDALIHRFIDQRRQSGEDKGDLLSMLLMARDDEGSGMTDKQVRDEAVTLFGAGHETTAVTLSWAIYLLAQHPEIAAKLRAEVDQALGGRAATLDDLANLSYTEMIVKEAMRLYPPAWGTSRELIDDVTINGHTIAKGNVIIMSFHALHRDARWWDEPERFQPERFQPENEKKLHKYAYLPFGAGPRVCIGNAFAMMEAKLVLATIAQHFEWSLVPGYPVIAERMFTLRPKNGVRVVLKARQARSETLPGKQIITG